VFQSTLQCILTCQQHSSLALQHCVRYPQNAWAMSKGEGSLGRIRSRNDMRELDSA
jgi:hypothetical protein